MNNDVFFHIVSYCDLATLAKLRQTCKWLNQCIPDPKLKITVPIHLPEKQPCNCDDSDLDYDPTVEWSEDCPKHCCCEQFDDKGGRWCKSTSECPQCKSTIPCSLNRDDAPYEYAEAPSYFCKKCFICMTPCHQCYADGASVLCKLVSHCCYLLDGTSVGKNKDDERIDAPQNTFYYDVAKWMTDGPEGGMGSHWKCLVCSSKYYLSNK